MQKAITVWCLLFSVTATCSTIIERTNDLGIDRFTVSRGEVTVASGGYPEPLLIKYDDKGKRIADSGQFYGLAINALKSTSDGSVYVIGFGDGNKDHFRKYSADLKLLSDTILRCDSKSMDVDGNDHIFIAQQCSYGETARIEIDVLDRDLKLLKTYPLAWHGNSTFHTAQYMAIDTAGKFLYAVDGFGDQIAKINLETNEKMTVVDASASGVLTYPLGLTVDSQGRLFIIDHVSYMTEVMKIFSAAGTPLKSFGDSANVCPCSTAFLNPHDVVIKGADVYILDQLAKPHGTLLKVNVGDLLQL